MQHDLYRFRPVGARSDEVKLVKRLMNAQSVNSRPLLAVEGLWAYERILENPGCLKVFLFDPESVSNEHEAQIVELLASASERTYTISGRVSRMLTNRDNPTGYFCVYELPPVDLREVSPGDSSLVVVLDQLDSPGNIGTILRVAEGAGCDLVISCDSKVSRLHPKLAKASATPSMSQQQPPLSSTRQACTDHLTRLEGYDPACVSRITSSEARLCHI